MLTVTDDFEGPEIQWDLSMPDKSQYAQLRADCNYDISELVAMVTGHKVNIAQRCRVIVMRDGIEIFNGLGYGGENGKVTTDEPMPELISGDLWRVETGNIGEL